MKNPPIIVTGASGRGKSEFSERLAHYLGYRRVNVGDILRKKLSERSVFVEKRNQIGPLFFQYFSKEDYYATLKGITKPKIILDGVRLAEGVEQLRADWSDLIHIHLTLHRGSTTRPYTSLKPEVYDSELTGLERIANYRFDWIGPLPRLESKIKETFGFLRRDAIIRRGLAKTRESLSPVEQPRFPMPTLKLDGEKRSHLMGLPRKAKIAHPND